MRTFVLAAVAALSFMISVSPTVAQAQARPKSIWYVCSSLFYISGSGRTAQYFYTEPFEAKGDIVNSEGMGLFLLDEIADPFRGHLSEKSGLSPKEEFSRVGCKLFDTRSEANEWLRSVVDASYKHVVQMPQELLSRLVNTSETGESDNVREEETTAKIATNSDSVALKATEARETREAEWQAELDKYAAEKAAWEAKIDAQKRAEERKRAAHAAAQEKAALAKAAHEAKMDAHSTLLGDYLKRQQEYEDARNRHTLCVNGNKQACDEIAAGKPAAGEKLADAGEASTDTEATTCVSRPVVSGNATFQGNTAAIVVNGCETAVDVRICLMREGGWNCGVKWGLQPQERWSHSSFKATGEIFWDARVAGSSEPLSSPGGS